MADSARRLILANGEKYVEGVRKNFRGRSPEPPRSYEEARELVKRGISSAMAALEALPVRKRLDDEAVFCLRLHPDATAKSYDPVNLFQDVPDLRKVGSRTYRENATNVAPTERTRKLAAKNVPQIEGRLIFVQSNLEGFQRLKTHLDRRESDLRKQAVKEIRRIERFDNLAEDEQIVGFREEWAEGRVELILHPPRTISTRQQEFVFGLFQEAGIERSRAQVRSYPGGPTFVSCRATRKALAALAGVNPLRSVIQHEGLLLRVYNRMKDEYEGIVPPELQTVKQQAQEAAIAAGAAEIQLLTSALVPAE